MGDTANLGSDAWRLVANKIALPKRLGGWGIRTAVSKCVVGRVACVIDCVRRGQGSAEAKNRDPSKREPARAPLFPQSILGRMRSALLVLCARPACLQSAQYFVQFEESGTMLRRATMSADHGRKRRRIGSKIGHTVYFLPLPSRQAQSMWSP